MPSTLAGSVEDRFAYLDRIGRRCTGNGSYCINAATDEFDVIPAKDGKPVAGGKEEIVMTCGRHRMQVLGSSRLIVKAHRKNCLSGSSELRRLVV